MMVMLLVMMVMLVVVGMKVSMTGRSRGGCDKVSAKVQISLPLLVALAAYFYIYFYKSVMSVQGKVWPYKLEMNVCVVRV